MKSRAIDQMSQLRSPSRPVCPDAQEREPRERGTCAARKTKNTPNVLWQSSCFLSELLLNQGLQSFSS